jgi:hypothetical protein
MPTIERDDRASMATESTAHASAAACAAVLFPAAAIAAERAKRGARYALRAITGSSTVICGTRSASRWVTP